jgi:hypothetical protein
MGGAFHLGRWESDQSNDGANSCKRIVEIAVALFRRQQNADY